MEYDRGAVYVGLTEHLGDIIACEPVSRYLKSVYPDRPLIWVARPLYAEVLATNPHIDHFHAVDCLTEWIRLSKHVRDESVIVDLHVNYRVCECCGIPLVKATGKKTVSVHDWYDYGALLEAFSLGAGLPRLNDQPMVYIQPENVRNVDALALPEDFIAIHRLSNDPQRDWDDRKWTLLVQLLRADGHTLVEIGDRDKRGAPAMRGDGYLDLRGRTSVLDTAEVLKRAQLFVGIDSGPAHIANALQRPGVILLGVLGNFRKYTPYTGYYASRSPQVKLLRNPAGPASDIAVSDVYDAICYALNAPGRVPHGKRVDLMPSATPHPAAAQPADAVQVLAFYLPQFHPIPENDNAWGPGFTEWTNIVRARPLFGGHHQPVEPGELGYYDLRNPDTIRRQAELAAAHGVTGFCFYYYYFSGKHVLKTPLDLFLENAIPMPFCVLWANHNWTRKWDAGESEVIIEQRHDEYDDVFFIRSLFDMFRDPRYIRVAGKPVLGVFMPHLFPDIKNTTLRWREEAEKAGFAGLFLFMVDDWTGDMRCPGDQGFDATYEMPSNAFGRLADHQDSVSGLVKAFSGRIVDYEDLARLFRVRPFPSYKRLKTVMAPWDNAPRYKERAIVCRHTGYGDYRRWLTSAIVDTYCHHQEGERFVFLHSWNEWAEGTYIEPSSHEGRARLEATRDAIEAARRVIGVIQRSARRDAEWAGALQEYAWYLEDASERTYRFAGAGAKAGRYAGHGHGGVPAEIHAAVLEENERLNHLVAVYENSRSMQITKPLRLLVAKIRKGQKGV